MNPWNMFFLSDVFTFEDPEESFLVRLQRRNDQPGMIDLFYWLKTIERLFWSKIIRIYTKRQDSGSRQILQFG